MNTQKSAAGDARRFFVSKKIPFLGKITASYLVDERAETFLRYALYDSISVMTEAVKIKREPPVPTIAPMTAHCDTKNSSSNMLLPPVLQYCTK